jgi:alpha-ketoglutarate-dependent taurine dioxygenase
LFWNSDPTTPFVLHAIGPLTPAHPLVGGLDDDHPEVLVLDSTNYPLGVGSSNKATSYNNRWHTDVTFSQTPPAMSILSAKRIPSRGGDTLWCDLEDGFSSLSEPLRVMLEGLYAIHSTRSTFARYQTMLPNGTANARANSQEPVRHPVVRVHPESGKPALFVNPTFTNEIEGLSPAESTSILQLLYAHSIEPERVVRWHWKEGDIAMWDNRNTAHYAAADYTEPRLMHRVTVAGTKPFGVRGPDDLHMH